MDLINRNLANDYDSDSNDNTMQFADEAGNCERLLHIVIIIIFHIVCNWFIFKSELKFLLRGLDWMAVWLLGQIADGYVKGIRR